MNINKSPAPLYAGLRIDVDTLRGTKDGVPRLLAVLARRGIFASIFFSVGPDNMGRHLWRLLNPAFLLKMIRSGAPSLYGWDIVLRGTFGPGPNIGIKAGNVMRNAVIAGHEIGFHAWDHHRWQKYSDKMDGDAIYEDLRRGLEGLSLHSHALIRCSAAAGWKCTETTLLQKELFPLAYNSDCRGQTIFRPVVNGTALTPQIPVTMPTYDELIGRNNVTDENYNNTLLEHFSERQLNVLTIHAEVEGMSRLDLFEEFLDEADRRGIRFVPLSDLLPEADDIPEGKVIQGTIEGRAGTVCLQAVS